MPLLNEGAHGFELPAGGSTACGPARTAAASFAELSMGVRWRRRDAPGLPHFPGFDACVGVQKTRLDLAAIRGFRVCRERHHGPARLAAAGTGAGGVRAE